MLDSDPARSRSQPARARSRSSRAPKDFRLLARLRRAAWAFTTRRVCRDAVEGLGRRARAPRAGDLVLARVDALGQHRGLQLVNGRRRQLFPGDEIVVAYGHRYAPNQFEAVVPQTLGPCQLVAGGGVAAKALSWHSRISRGPTEITPLGLLADATGEPLNLRDHALPALDAPAGRQPTTIAIVGTSMDSGKTDTAAFLARGLSLGGVRVGYAKITGTGAGGDTWLLKDAGADPVLDFTDAGLASTYRCDAAEIERTLVTLMTHIAKSGVDAIVIEVADGVLQPETAALLASPRFLDLVGGVVFAARDSMGAAAGVDWLRPRGVPVIGLSGLLTASPLMCREASQATALPVFSRERLVQAPVAMKILALAEDRNAVGGMDVATERAADGPELVAAAEAGLAPGAPG